MEKRETAGAALRSAVAELQYAARVAGIIASDERIDYIAGSRSYGQPPQVDIRGPKGTRPLDLMPNFTHTTRAKEVAMAMETAATTLRRFIAEGILPVGD